MVQRKLQERRDGWRIGRRRPWDGEETRVGGAEGVRPVAELGRQLARAGGRGQDPCDRITAEVEASRHWRMGFICVGQFWRSRVVTLGSSQLTNRPAHLGQDSLPMLIFAMK